MKIPDYNELKNIEVNKTGLYIGIAVFVLLIVIGFYVWPSGNNSNKSTGQNMQSGAPEYLKKKPDTTKFNPYQKNNKGLTSATPDSNWKPPKPEQLFGKKRAQKLKAQAMGNGYRPSSNRGSTRRNYSSNNHSNYNQQNNRQKTTKKAKESEMFIKGNKPGQTDKENYSKPENRRPRANNKPSPQEQAASAIANSQQAGYNSSLGVGGSGGIYRKQDRSYPRAGEGFSHTDGHQISSKFRTPKTPYTIQEGTLIPATLITGITSDLPGDITAIVNRNVYDSIHQRYLLIPKGSKLIGSYDNRVVLSQSKLLMSWQRIIYPDGRSLNLPRLNSYDLQGESGLSGKVNRHFWHIFGQSALLSLIGAGASVATHPDQNSGGYYGQQQGIGQVTAQQIATSFNRVANQTLERNLNQPPTIHISQGKRFNIYLAGDISFPKPYEYKATK